MSSFNIFHLFRVQIRVFKVKWTMLLIIVAAIIILLCYYLNSAFNTSSLLVLKSHQPSDLEENDASNCQSPPKKPLCIDGILQRERRPPGVNSPPVLLTDGDDPNQVNRDCRLHHYTQVDVTACIDELSYRRAKHKEPVHIAFIGESIIRHQFMSFLRLIPDYDLQMKRSAMPKGVYFYQEDRNVTSEALNLRLSFYWRPLANEELIATFREWNTPPYRSTPDYIVMGLVLNHMSPQYGNDYSLFAKGLTELKPILQQLSNVTRIVWVQQAPIVDGTMTIFSFIFLGKVHGYNAGMRHILEGSGVNIWDSIDPVAMQYVRSCNLLERSGLSDSNMWHLCWDSVHTGYVTLEHSSQVTFNDLCNRIVLPWIEL